MTTKKFDEQSIKLLRHELGSIDLSDIEDKELDGNERKAYCAAIFAVWPRLEKDLKKFLYQQLMFSANEALSWEQVLVGRGTFNGIDLLLEHWKKAAAEHTQSKPDKEDFDRSNPMPEI